MSFGNIMDRRVCILAIKLDPLLSRIHNESYDMYPNIIIDYSCSAPKILYFIYSQFVGRNAEMLQTLWQHYGNVAYYDTWFVYLFIYIYIYIKYYGNIIQSEDWNKIDSRIKLQWSICIPTFRTNLGQRYFYFVLV